MRYTFLFFALWVWDSPCMGQKSKFQPIGTQEFNVFAKSPFKENKRMGIVYKKTIRQRDKKKRFERNTLFRASFYYVQKQEDLSFWFNNHGGPAFIFREIEQEWQLSAGTSYQWVRSRFRHEMHVKFYVSKNFISGDFLDPYLGFNQLDYPFPDEKYALNAGTGFESDLGFCITKRITLGFNFELTSYALSWKKSGNFTRSRPRFSGTKIRERIPNFFYIGVRF